MGTYNIKLDEFLNKFEGFLQGFEGDVCAELISDAWNRLADKYHWTDFVRVESWEPCNIEIEVEKGCVEEVRNLPSGWTYEIIDKDIQE